MKVLKAQAGEVGDKYPELFRYLVRRDEATSELLAAYAQAIPDPDDIPDVDIPFIDIFVELSAPRDDCPICDEDEDDDAWFLLSAEMRARLCHFCRHGIYVRRTGIGSLRP
jgi:hypothetical protein